MFELALHPTDTPLAEPFPILELDPELELDSVPGLLLIACELIQEAKAASFTLRCGGAQPWPVEIQGELSMILEALVPALEALRSGAGSFRFELTEQGVETALEFTRVGETLEVRAVDLFDARPSRFGSEVERVELGALVQQLHAVVEAFVAAVRRVCPALIDEDTFRMWLRDVRRLIAELKHRGTP